MKKFFWAWFVIWALGMLVICCLLAAKLAAQDTVYIWQGHAKTDSAFQRRTASHIDQQLDVNYTIFTALRDHARKNFILEHRLDSLRRYVQEWSARQPKKKVGKR